MPLRSFASRAKRRAKAVVDNLKKDNTSIHDKVKADAAAKAAAAPPEPSAPAPKAAAPKTTTPKPAAPVAAAAEAPKPAAPKKAAEKAAAKPAEKKAAPALGFAALAAKAAAGDLDEAVHADSSSTDLEAYKQRAKLLGRDVENLASEGMNTADDGTSFWGPIDCESSRAKAEGLVLNIDQELCISCGTCEENTDLVFYLPNEEDAKAEVLAQDGPMDLIQDAIDACPVMCITWSDDGDLPERVSPTPDELSKQLGA